MFAVLNHKMHLQDDEIFRTACCYGQLEIAKWLLETYPSIDIRKPYENGIYNHTAFVWACEYGRLEVAKWLQTFNPNYTIFNKELTEIDTKYDAVLGNLFIKQGPPTTEECNLCCDDELQNIISLPCNHYFCLKCLLLDGQKNQSHNCRYCMKHFIFADCVNHPKI